MKHRLIAAIAAGILLLAGCSPDASPTERVVDKLVTDAVKPTLDKALKETSITNGSFQGSVQGIEPGYEGEFEGYWVTGVKGRVSVRAVGVSGLITGNISGTGKHLPGGNPGVPDAIAPSNGAGPTVAKQPAASAPAADDTGLEQLN